jgi:crotonobetaine/carnitine-CoA ligase
MILFSSGTTGEPKGCVISHGYLVNFARLGLQNVPRDADDTTWSPLPLFHLAGLAHVVAAVLTGGRLVLADQFSVSSFWRDVAAADATVATLMSSMIPRIAAAEYAELPAHRLRRVTGEPFPPALRATWRERFGVTETGSTALGQTEAGFLTTLRGHDYRPGTCGLATDSFDLAVLGEDGVPVGPGEVGELVCRPTREHAMFDGYLDEPPHGVRPDGDRYWHTGDLVHRDTDGYFYFVGRGAERIRRNGENVASAQIEAAALTHPLVEQAAAVGLPGEADDTILLVVTPTTGSTVDPGELRDWVAHRLPAFAVPDAIDVVDVLPVNASGKVLKRVLRERRNTPC